MTKYEHALYYDIFTKRCYGFLDPAIADASVIFDVGGNIGFFAARCFAQNQTCTIHFFEPILSFCVDAQQRLQVWQDRLQVYPAAAWTQEGEISFFYNATKPMQSSLWTNHFLDPRGEEMDVATLDFAAFVASFPDRIDVLKMDIEGAEFAVLERFTQEHFQRIGSIAIEYHVLFP